MPPKRKATPKIRTFKQGVKKVKETKKSTRSVREKIIITAALPYANGPIHVGHLLEYIQADIFSRFLKLQGKDALYICASDMHGTPIEVNAQKAGEKPEVFVEKFWKEHQADFAAYHIAFDNYYKTHSPENKALAELFFNTLKKKGHIFTKNLHTVYCTHCARYLPDRFVKGTCPNCTTANQYGDICESCSSTLKGTDLINPRCVLCGKNPVQKESTHYFFRLSAFTEQLKKWLKSAEIQPEIAHQLQEWLDKGLENWCISRDAPYFGFEIPGAEKETGEKKYFYVWLDAPIGYISSTENYCLKKERTEKSKNPNRSRAAEHLITKEQRIFTCQNRQTNFDHTGISLPKFPVLENGSQQSCGVSDPFSLNEQERKGKEKKVCTWESYWKKGKVYHFIGKDIVYFHFLFWPAMLLAMDIPLPQLTVHGFITVNGEKMSKSRGTFVTAKEFLALFSPEALRFFFASHLERKVLDVDLNFEELKAVTNNVLLGSLGNFCFRVLTFAEKNYGGVEHIAQEKEIELKVKALVELTTKHYFAQDFQSAVKDIITLADLGNSYFQKSEVWKKKDTKESKAAVGWCVNIAKNLAVLVSPILPEFSTKIAKALKEKNLSLEDINFSWKGSLNGVDKLVEKIELLPSRALFPLHLVVGKILQVKNHPQADTLYLLDVDFGNTLGKRQVVAGLKKYFSREDLEWRKAIFCLNIKPATIRGEVSQAMILVAEDGKHLALLEAEKSNLGEEVLVQGMKSSDAEITFEEFKKLHLEVRHERVWVESKKLATAQEEVVVHGLADGGKVG